jgi:hypothetical protein
MSRKIRHVASIAPGVSTIQVSAAGVENLSRGRTAALGCLSIIVASDGLHGRCDEGCESGPVAPQPAP